MPEWRHRLEPFDSPRAMRYRRVAGVSLVSAVALSGISARGWSVATYWVATSVLGLFVASLLAHEWAHRLAAKAWHAPAISLEACTPPGAGAITSASTPRSEAIAASAGPLLTAVLALAFALLALAVRRVSDSAASAFGLVAIANAVLLAISLLPGYPLDGGRLLRALIWRVTDDRLAGTRLTSWYGQVLGWCLMGGGVLLFGESPDPLGAVTALVGGWLLRVEARAGYQAERWRELSHRVPVYQAAFLRAPRIRSDRLLSDAIEDVLEAAGRQNEGGPALVVDATGLVTGVIGLGEFRRAGRASWGAVTVGDAMIPRESVVTVAQSLTIGRLFEAMRASGASYVLVTADGGREPIGVLSKDRLERQIVRLLRDKPPAQSERVT